MEARLSEISLLGVSGRGEIRGTTTAPPPSTKASKQIAKQQAISNNDVINR